MGRPKCDAVKMLKIILFAFVKGGYASQRELEKRCKTDIRYMWLLNEMKAPSFVTFNNFINNELKDSTENIFQEINGYISAKGNVDTTYVYIDGTKIEANANRYTWVWKKSCLKNRSKVYERLTALIQKSMMKFYLITGSSLKPVMNMR